MDFDIQRVLIALPVLLRFSDILRSRITALYDYARTGVPFWEGGRWYYSKNSGLQRQNVWYARASLEGAEAVVLDVKVRTSFRVWNTSFRWFVVRRKSAPNAGVRSSTIGSAPAMQTSLWQADSSP